jgi:hypothetical protein
VIDFINNLKNWHKINKYLIAQTSLFFQTAEYEYQIKKSSKALLLWNFGIILRIYYFLPG